MMIIIIMIVIMIVIPVGHGGIVLYTVVDKSFLKEMAAFELMQVSRGVSEKAPK